ncbi:MAG: DUF4959 domain-containing protein [Bacteroidales bacterium]|nr:DUF4959 domain-containing protein [Bacteroidales bacterium]
MKRYILNTAVFLMFSAFIMSCSEPPIGQTPTNGTPPSPLANVVITPTNGGASVTYTLPDEEDISYVKGTFEYNGKKRTVRASVYQNKLVVDGIGAVVPIELTLTLVNNSEVESIPHVETFTPLEPPMDAILKSFMVEPAFGGVKVSWENPAKEMAGISFLADNDNGVLELNSLLYTSLPTGEKYIRGFNTDPRRFALSIVDKFENESDTVFFERTPLYEIKLDKSLFRTVYLDGEDINIRGTGRTLDKIWDDISDNDDAIWHSSDDFSVEPQRFTVNLGQTTQLTRIMIWGRAGDYHYAQHNMRKFAIWGTDELKWDRADPRYATNEWKADWNLLAECEIIKPSGSAMGTNTAEDIAAAIAGFEFEFDQNVPKVKYIRFEVHETWGKTLTLHVAEISVFGDDRP